MPKTVPQCNVVAEPPPALAGGFGSGKITAADGDADGDGDGDDAADDVADDAPVSDATKDPQPASKTTPTTAARKVLASDVLPRTVRNDSSPHAT
ncbi:MAG TPA: hypothetical protein VEH05_17070, partial [Streptosporangiaceae bacterium]|nr:hypothetical protein [Streptosporangiaceae bacterium]